MEENIQVVADIAPNPLPMDKEFADMDGMLMTVSLLPKSYLLTILLTCLSYFGSLLVLRRKITKVDMIESLKDNRE